MSALDDIEQLLSGMSRAEKAQVLQWVVRDLGDAFPGIASHPDITKAVEVGDILEDLQRRRYHASDASVCMIAHYQRVRSRASPGWLSWRYAATAVSNCRISASSI